MNSRTTRSVFTTSLYGRALANAVLCEEVNGKFLLFFIAHHDIQLENFALNPCVETPAPGLKQKFLKQLRPSSTFRCELWVCLQLDEGSFILRSRQASILRLCRKVRFLPGGLACTCSWRDMMVWLVTPKALLLVHALILQVYFVIFVSLSISLWEVPFLWLLKSRNNKQWLI